MGRSSTIPRGRAEAAVEPTNPRRPRAVKAREKLASWVRQLGVKDIDVRPNHAWRHTFKQTARRHGISDAVSDEITGHAPLSVGRGYGSPTLADMAAELRKFPRYDVSRDGADMAAELRKFPRYDVSRGGEALSRMIESALARHRTAGRPKGS
jgi:hypothetical protein